MTDDEFETFWALESREDSKPGFPDYNALRGFALKHPDGINPRKLLRRFEVEGYSRGNVQIALGRATDLGYLRLGKGWEFFAGDRARECEVFAP